MYTGVGERPRTLNPGYSLGQFFLTGASGCLSSEQLLKKQSGSLGDRDGFVLLNGEYLLLMTNKTEIRNKGNYFFCHRCGFKCCISCEILSHGIEFFQFL